MPSRRPASSAARRPPTRWRSGRSCTAWGPGKLPIGQRTVITQIRNVEDNVPPLDRAELDHVLACFRSLQARRPELAQAEILQYVDDELKRAKRGDEEDRFYREVVAGANADRPGRRRAEHGGPARRRRRPRRAGRAL